MSTIDIIIISILTLIGTIINIQLLNHNWFKRAELKSKYRIKEIQARKRAKMPPKPLAPEPSNPISNLPTLLNMAKGLDSDQIHGLVDAFTGESTPEASGDMLESIIANNPELVQSFIDGFTKKKESGATETDFTAQTQV